MSASAPCRAARCSSVRSGERVPDAPAEEVCREARTAIGYSGATLDVPIELIQHAERLGFDSVWTAEAYGSDAITPLAWIAAKTERIRLGTGIMQLAGAAAGDVRDAVHDRRRARRRRPHDRRPRRVRTADRRGLVRAAVGQAVLAAARLHPDHAQGLRARGARRPRRPRDLPALHRTRQHRARQAAALDHPRRPAAADLDGLGQGGDRAPDGRAVRRLAADALRARAHGRVPAMARGGLRPRPGRRPRRRLAPLRDPGPGRRAHHRRRRRRARRPEAGHRPVRRAGWAPAR